MADEITVEELVAENTVKSTFDTLDGDRSSIRTRLQECSELTLPYILLPTGSDENSEMYHPEQSFGARAVNNLASKLLMALFPPNTPFFQLKAQTEVLQELLASQDGNSFIKFEEAMSNAETLVHNEIERQAFRSTIFEALKHLIVTGNALLYKLPEEGMKLYTFDQYVITRDFEGKALDIIIKEGVSPRLLEPSLVDTLNIDDPDADIDVYTRVYKVGPDKWISYQEIDEELVEGSEETYNTENNPYFALRWSAIDGEDYGRGLTEQYLGDLRKLEGFSKNISDASGLMSKILFSIKQGSTMTPKKLGGMKTGDFVFGDFEREVSTLKIDKHLDMNIPLQMLQSIEARLSQAYLLNSSVARDSERTTATEVRFMASELEDALGGVYSILAIELQYPIVISTIAKMKLELPDGVEPSVLTGLEALNREKDLQKLQVFTSLIQNLSPELVAQYVNFGSYISKIAVSLGVETTGLIKTQEEIQAEQQRQAQLQAQAQGAQIPQQQPQK